MEYDAKRIGETRTVKRFAVFPRKDGNGKWFWWKRYLAVQKLVRVVVEAEVVVRFIWEEPESEGMVWVTQKRWLIK